jgi:hypothetical protein
LGDLTNNNTAVGQASLQAITTGTANTAVGYVALANNTTGSANSATGSQSLGSNLTGSFNNAYGFQALDLNTGSGNCAFGAYSGSDITTGSNNVVVGGYTGLAAPISATGSNYIVLSDGAGTVRQTIDPSGNVSFTGSGTFTNLVSSGTAASSFTVTSGTAVPLTITNVGTGNSFLIEDSASPDASPFVIDAGGGVIVGYTTQVGVQTFNGVNVSAKYFQAGTGYGGSGMTTSLWSATASATPTFNLARSKSAAIGTMGVVANGDSLGAISYAGDDGTNFLSAAGISAAVDGTPGTNDMPGRLVFSTTADGASTPTERIRIDSAGNVGIGATANASAILDAQSTTKGVRMPNMTTTQKNAIASPAAGLMVFDTTLAKLAVYSGTAWQTITSV